MHALEKRRAGMRTYVTTISTHGAQRRPLPKTIQPRSPEDWKPEPCLLTREQLRAIVIEQLG